ncbi:MraY family glycosyltransferase [Stutzerimonas tarimensis]|uniref:Glycosyltransferase family 4 protein n=1 Tax=Stutzerimonas tarimensis TaxID=1507735 RepID=A0ABV7T5U5_9GAMM
MMSWWWLPAVAGLSLMLAGSLRHYAQARDLVDVPNARSSHSTPTPRGGGVAIVVSFLLVILALFLGGTVEPSLAWALLGGGLAVAALGFFDDHGHIPAGWRLLGHFCAATWALAWLGGFPPLVVLGMELDLGWFGHIGAAVYLVWLLNLYNFMDGIDGIASVQAITLCLGGALLFALLATEAASRSATILLLLAAAVAGFLYWNFPPARLFMGDAGSGFLGMAFGILSLHAAWQAPVLLWSWLILLGVFIVDATFTLLRRLMRGERVHEAHRSHAYQAASRRHGGHLPVTLGVMVINLAWLLPIAVWVAWGGLDGMLGLIVAYVPLVLLAIRYGAGGREAP